MAINTGTSVLSDKLSGSKKYVLHCPKSKNICVTKLNDVIAMWTGTGKD